MRLLASPGIVKVPLATSWNDACLCLLRRHHVHTAYTVATCSPVPELPPSLRPGLARKSHVPDGPRRKPSRPSARARRDVPQTAHAGTRNAPGTRLKRLVSFAETPHGPAATRRLAEDLSRFPCSNHLGGQPDWCSRFWLCGTLEPTELHLVHADAPRELYGGPESLV